jgi:type IV pilus assembly protein PilB
MSLDLEQSAEKNMLGEALLERGIITENELSEALEKQNDTGHYLGELLVREGYAEPGEIYPVIAEHVGIQYCELCEDRVEMQAVDAVPGRLARRFGVMPVEIRDGNLMVATSDHLDFWAMDVISTNTGHPVEPLLSPQSSIRKFIDTYYGEKEKIEEDLRSILDNAEEEAQEEDLESVQALEMEARDTPVVRFVNLIIREAVEEDASDLHIEPTEDGVDVRARIDGVLRPLTCANKNMFSGIVSRIKIMASLDIGEKRLPQDGRFRLSGRNIDVRVSTLPTIDGEKVVMRLLDRDNLLLDLSKLGFEPDQQDYFETALAEPQGIVLVTGPTGSGKTTTLYSGLGSMKRDDKNVVTVEDPVEYQLPQVNQVQIRPDIGLTFASGLRSILRQDPDVIMVGEIRDLETARVAIRAALTGHLVLSTLHTNGAVATITRLHDMGVEPYLVGSCLSLVMAQRLVRRICEECNEPFEVGDHLSEKLGLPQGHLCYRGAGCRYCHQSGYRGRVALYEMLPMTRDLRDLTAEGASEPELLHAANERGFVTLREAGIEKVRQGLTTPEEVLSKTME